jgi:uncharacterized protein YjcR
VTVIDIPKYVNQRGAVKRLNPEFMARMEPYFEEGYSYKAVGEIFGVDQKTVKNWFPGRGWTYDQARELAAMTRQHNRDMRKVQPSYA